MTHLSARSRGAATLCIALLAVGAWAQAPKHTLKPADYPLWEMIGFAKLSNDAHWFTYAIGHVDGDRMLFIRNVDTPQRVDVPNGTTAAFSEDSKWVAYSIGVSKKEADAARDQKKPIELRLGLKNLATGEERTFESVQTWSFLKTSKFLIAQRYRTQPGQTSGGDLLVVNLQTGKTLTIGNVVDAAPNKEGTCLALAIDSGKYRGVQILDPATSSLRQLCWGTEHVFDIEWAEKSDTFAYFVGKDDEKKEGPWNTISVVTDVRKESPTVTVIDPAKIDAFPKGDRIVEYGGVDLAEDGSAVYFSVHKWDDKKKPATGNPDDKPNVDVWHYKDAEPQPLQQRKAGSERMRADTCAWVGGKFLKLGDDKLKDIDVLKGNRYAIASDSSPYETPVRVGGIDYSDWYVIDLSNGKRIKIREKTQWPVFPSIDGNYAAYYKDRNWWVYDIAKNSHKNVTAKLGTTFESVDYDGPQKEKPFEASPVWPAGDKGLLLYDKFDAWLIDPATGRGTRVTAGRPDSLVFRAVNVYTDDKPMGLDRPIYFSVLNDYTKASGVARREVDGTIKMLTMDDAAIGGLTKAKDADRMLFWLQTFEKSPNVYVTNGLFKEAKPLTGTNRQQANYLWGKAELVHYKSAWGKDLAGVLIYPADYKPGSSYPMVTYIYEKLSNGLHAYRIPIERDSYNAQVLSQSGYFVFMPDIAYRVREPGVSAVQCLEPAVAAVVRKHVGVDPQRVGLMGHSWGAYQTAYAVTVSKTFAAGVAGAPLTELMSMYNSFYWNSGQTNQVIFESSQGRFDVPWWDDMKAYMDNSPVFQAGKMNKPLMIAFGDQDGAVDWRQGQYLYNTLRRMGKFIIMLLYPGENHGLARKGNQLDYAHRLRHFFDVYLKGAKPEPWITEGVPFLKKDGG